MITVALFTYTPSLEHPRREYARRTLEAAMLHLRYEGELAWHIADDGSALGHVDALCDWLRESVITATSSNSERRGYGASYNAMTAVVHRGDDDLVLCLEDDWLLLKPLDLTPLTRAIAASDGELELIRLGYLGWSAPLLGGLRRWDGQTFLMFDPESPEYHVFSAGPRLETVRHQRAIGLWPEHVIAGDAEIVVAGRRASREGVAWPLDIGASADLASPTLFAHIGTVPVKNDPVAEVVSSA